MKIKQNHIVKTSGLIGLLGLVGITGLLVFWPWSLNSTSAENLAARKKAEVIAYQIVQIHKEATSERSEPVPVQSSRGLASVKSGPSAGGILADFKNEGSMGVDPWGRPFHYRIVEMTPGHSQLLVWSLGANGILDHQSFQSSNPQEALSLPQVGDDIRVSLPIKENTSN